MYPSIVVSHFVICHRGAKLSEKFENGKKKKKKIILNCIVNSKSSSGLLCETSDDVL